MKKTILFLLGWVICLSAYAQDGFKFQYGPYLQNVGEEEVTVVWVTNKEALGWVEVAPDDQSHFYAEERLQYFQTVNGRKVVGTLHKVTITGLQKGTKYRYRIYSREVLDNLSWDTKFGKIAASSPSKLYSFQTLNKSKEETSFVMINDIHADTEKLESLIKGTDINKQDFVLFNGDMMSHLNSEQLMFDGFVNKSVELFASSIPFFFTRGNHETRGPFATRFMDYFPTNTGKPYYAFRQGPAFFIMLDGGEDKPDTDIEYGGLSAFDIYRTEQAKWLQQVVESEEFKKSPVKIVSIHVPPFTGTWHGTLEVERLFIPILNRAGIDLMLCAHTHRHAYFGKGEKANNFPILINSNSEIVEIQVKGNKIDIRIKDIEGKVTSTFNLPEK